MIINRDTASVVRDGDRVIDVDGHIDMGRVASQRFVDRVVHHLVHQMMQPWSPVDPMYIAGRRRTASSPSRILMLSPV